MRGFYFQDEGGTGPLTLIGDYLGTREGDVFVEHSLPLIFPNSPEYLYYDGENVVRLDHWWHARISQRADTELQRGISVTIDGTTYGIRTGPQALALIDGAAIRADVAARNNQSVSRRVPTDQGIVQFDGPSLWSIFESVENHQQAVSTRAEELQQMVADGTITESDLDSGWP